ncbi:MAG: LLM class flavin-dependent oxidoreductase [Actinomycetota bacterium]
MWNRRRVRTCVWIYPNDSAHAIVDAIVELDRKGIDEVWIADEGVARDPFAILAAAARETSRIDLAVGITSPLLRHPGAVASTAMTIDELSGGRMILGWGVGGHESLGPFGLSTERPVAAVRDALRLASAVFDGRDTTGYEPPAHAAPPRRIRQFVGARGPQLNRLASREADGVFLSGFTADTASGPISDARSTRPIHVTLCISTRYSGAPDEWSIAGDPKDVAAHLRDAVERHRPDTIGVALVDRDPLDVMVSRAVSTFSLLG